MFYRIKQPILSMQPIPRQYNQLRNVTTEISILRKNTSAAIIIITIMIIMIHGMERYDIHLCRNERCRMMYISMMNFPFSHLI